MNDDIHRHLDGELPLEDLEEGARGEAESWERLLDAFRVDAPGAVAPPWLESRVMAEIEALPEPGRLRRVIRWILHPQPVRVSPLTVGVVTAALVGVLLLGRREVAVPPGGSTPSVTGTAATVASQGSEPVVYVEFLLEAPGATSVAVAGDFDGWEGSHVLSDPDGDGIWSGRVPVKPGVHAYMFLVDGSTWMTDPQAERYAEDGFGNRNAILAVTAPAA